MTKKSLKARIDDLERGAKVYSLKQSDLTSLPDLARPYREGESNP